MCHFLSNCQPIFPEGLNNFTFSTAMCKKFAFSKYLPAFYLITFVHFSHSDTLLELVLTFFFLWRLSKSTTYSFMEIPHYFAPGTLLMLFWKSSHIPILKCLNILEPWGSIQRPHLPKKSLPVSQLEIIYLS